MTVRALIAGSLVALSLGCAATQQARTVKPTGFLGDYSNLQPGKEGQALLVYVNPDAHFARYDKIAIDPVSVWRGTNSDLGDVPPDELQVLVDYLDSSLRDQLAKDYKIVDRPAPGTLRLRVAITEAEGAEVVLNTISTVIPQLRLLSTVKKLATGTHAFVGRAGVEAELQDAVTGARLVAAVDRRAGGKTFEGVLSTWDDVQKAYDYWAERVRVRLGELRTQQP